jgi:hypothetical protein
MVGLWSISMEPDQALGQAREWPRHRKSVPPAIQAEFEALIARWLDCGRSFPELSDHPPVNDVLLASDKHAEVCYSRDGQANTQMGMIRAVGHPTALAAMAERLGLPVLQDPGASYNRPSKPARASNTLALSNVTKPRCRASSFPPRGKDGFVDKTNIDLFGP